MHTTRHFMIVQGTRLSFCLDRSESSSDQPSGQEPQQDGSTVGVVDIRPAALLLPSSGDSELDSDIDAQNKSGYEASSDADSLSSGSSGEYVPPHLRQGHPYLLSKSVHLDQGLHRRDIESEGHNDNVVSHHGCGIRIGWLVRLQLRSGYRQSDPSWIGHTREF